MNGKTMGRVQIDHRAGRVVRAGLMGFKAAATAYFVLAGGPDASRQQFFCVKNKEGSSCIQ